MSQWGASERKTGERQTGPTGARRRRRNAAAVCRNAAQSRHLIALLNVCNAQRNPMRCAAGNKRTARTTLCANGRACAAFLQRADARTRSDRRRRRRQRQRRRRYVPALARAVREPRFGASLCCQAMCVCVLQTFTMTTSQQTKFCSIGLRTLLLHCYCYLFYHTSIVFINTVTAIATISSETS